mmetsp:Transcript_30569/g.53780  ORF Transcript_30569/g.53780 Transcript_30569/m.53780 type:complete len:89 (+) Transcript_30569:1431-1697(+)
MLSSHLLRLQWISQSSKTTQAVTHLPSSPEHAAYLRLRGRDAADVKVFKAGSLLKFCKELRVASFSSPNGGLKALFCARGLEARFLSL